MSSLSAGNEAALCGLGLLGLETEGGGLPVTGRLRYVEYRKVPGPRLWPRALGAREHFFSEAWGLPCVDSGCIGKHHLCFLKSAKGLLLAPSLLPREEGEHDLGELAGDGAAGGSLGLAAFPEPFVVEADAGVVLTSGGACDEQGHLEHAIAIAGHSVAPLRLATLPDDGVQAAVADELSLALEAAHVANFGHYSGSGDSPDPRDGREYLVREHVVEHLADGLVKLGQLVCELQDSLSCGADQHLGEWRQLDPRCLGSDGVQAPGEVVADPAGGLFRGG